MGADIVTLALLLVFFALGMVAEAHSTRPQSMAELDRRYKRDRARLEARADKYLDRMR